MKLIIKFDDDITAEEALGYAMSVINMGRISHNARGKQYCYHSIFASNVAVSAFKPSSRTDTLVIYKTQAKAELAKEK